MFKQLCGTINLNSVILATTQWNNAEDVGIPEEVGKVRIKELTETRDFWSDMVERGRTVVRHDGSQESALQMGWGLVRRRNRVSLGTAKQLIDQKRTLDDTDAGQALQSELIAGRKKFQQRELELREDIEHAIQEKDEKWQREMAERNHGRENQKRGRHKEVVCRGRSPENQHEENRRGERRTVSCPPSRNGTTKTTISTHKEEHRRLAEEHRREREEADARATRERHEHNERMIALQERMREESDQAMQVQSQKERQESDRRYQQQQEDARTASEAAE